MAVSAGKLANAHLLLSSFDMQKVSQNKFTENKDCNEL
jgi:hypothetical protein